MTEIQWTNETWNPIVGCTIDTKGCKNCYATSMRLKPDRRDTHRGRNVDDIL